MNKDRKLRTVEANKNATCEKQFGRVGEYLVKYVRVHNAPDHAQHVVAQVAVNNKVIWNFRDEHSKDLAYFLELDGTCCICLVSKKKELRRVIWLDALHAKIEQEERIKELEVLAKKKLKTLLG
ncbi:hypothetical protein HY839_02775 [Candidatus Azambacteria bacterium]|nr:hypothetical protein [Candidatus Azambacteria bacterium]